MTAESDGAAAALTAGPRLGSRAPAFIRRSRPLHLAWQVGVFVVGLAVVVAGVVLLPLPGPGWLVIFGGMAIWGTEFPWAQKIVFLTRRKVAAAGRWTKRRLRRGPAAGEEPEADPAAGPGR